MPSQFANPEWIARIPNVPQTFTFTVTIEKGDEPDEVFAYYFRDGVKIALASRHNNLMAEISLWILEGKMPANATFYRF